MPEKPEFLTVKDAAQYLRIHPVTFWRMVKGGLIPGAFQLGGRRQGGSWRIKRIMLEEHFENSVKASQK